MYIAQLELNNFRNFESLKTDFSKGTNIFYGDNAQGKTNLLEAIFMIATTKSHRGVKDRDLLRFGQEEAHIRTVLYKKDIDYRIDMHLRKNRAKGIAINGQRIKKASELLGLLNIVFFSPEDLAIVKSGPAQRRRFLDIELCQLEENYLFDLNYYNRIIDQRNRLLKEIEKYPNLHETLDIWDKQLLDSGKRIIRRRKTFIEELNEIIRDIHLKLSGGKEILTLRYEPNVTEEEFETKLRQRRQADIYQKITTCGPHRDDFGFFQLKTAAPPIKGAAGEDSLSMNGEEKEKEITQAEELDFRRFGSQGQQRTCALSLKLAEIEIVKKAIGDNPVLMLDDVLSELDSGRQQYLLNTIGGLQTFITCTGLEEFVNERFSIDQVYRVEEGTVTKLEEAETVRRYERKIS
ncbi:MAG: DNA replication/repair protein RecF [Lachnospiraceae bacterium]|nr:DNA replication/repair protein RecF [Lachnospiraceae bacterium]